jgi:hypothetical protein
MPLPVTTKCGVSREGSNSRQNSSGNESSGQTSSTWPLATERGYFRTNAQRMHYSTYREQGWPIGSGAVESAPNISCSSE